MSLVQIVPALPRRADRLFGYALALAARLSSTVRFAIVLLLLDTGMALSRTDGEIG